MYEEREKEKEAEIDEMMNMIQKLESQALVALKEKTDLLNQVK